MKKIIYLHGFGSSGATQTADYLRNKLPEIEVISPDIPLQPEEAIQMLNRLCYEVKPNVIVGTSMGAMYAQQLHGYKKILVNPAFHVSEIMRNNIGTNKWLNPRRDGQTEFLIDEELCDLYQQMEESQFDGITEFDKKHTRAFFGTEDTLVDGYDEYMQNYIVATTYPGEH
ncbi:MAG: YqiA/YcfP family alpha/beta fold hydrolase, partial [Prevotella sp.]|nr:YqiA/YcfP family alpha/beta fold hydrolase [Prevotella sp.]